MRRILLLALAISAVSGAAEHTVQELQFLAGTGPADRAATI